MHRRPTATLTRRVVLLAVGAALTTAGATALAPQWGGTSVAWAETQSISDGSTARAPDRVKIGGMLRITGKGWTTPGGTGSVIAIKLDDGEVKATGPVINPATDDPISDASVVAAVRAKRNGSFSISVPVPDSTGWTAGSRHSVRLVSGRLLSDDATRSVALTFDLVTGAREPSATPSPTRTASAEPTPSHVPSSSESPPTQPEVRSADEPSASASPTSGGATASPSATQASRTPTATPRSDEKPAARRVQNQDPARGGAPEHAGGSEEETTSEVTAAGCQSDPTVRLTAKAATRGVPVVELGGTLALSGTGFCHPSGGGSLIGVQIDDGRLARLDSTIDADRSIWQVVEAGADGTFSTTVRVPEAHQADPDFTEGLHRLSLITGSLRAGDAVRRVRTSEFVVAAGNNAGVLPEPTSTPTPVNPEVALVGSKAGAVTAAQSGSTVRVVVPDLEPGDWVFPYAFGERTDDMSGQPVTWLQLDANRSVVVDAADVAVSGAHATRVSLQARDGTLVGWAPVVASSVDSGAAAAPTAPSSTADDGVDASEDAAAPSPRFLVLVAGGSLTMIGLLWLALARHRRLRLIRELNER